MNVPRTLIGMRVRRHKESEWVTLLFRATDLAVEDPEKGELGRTTPACPASNRGHEEDGAADAARTFRPELIDGGIQ